MKTNNNIAMNTTNNHINNIVAALSERISINKEITLPVIAAIREAAPKFNNKVFNRRFTTAVTNALANNSNRIRVNFSESWSSETHYDIIKVNYNHAGKYGDFCIYPDRNKVNDYTDKAGRLVAEKLLNTCERYEVATAENIASDENAIARAPEFVARVEALQAEAKTIADDFPRALCAYFRSDINIRK